MERDEAGSERGWRGQQIESEWKGSYNMGEPYLQSHSVKEGSGFNRVKHLVTVMSMGREPIRNPGKWWQQVFVRVGVFESDSLILQ